MKKFGKSIRGRILIPLTAILLIQSVILFAFVIYGGVSQRLHQNAVEMLVESAENDRLQMERELVSHWMRDIQTSAHVGEAAGQTLEDLNRTAGEIRLDPELNRQLVDGMMDSLIELLHRSYGTGIFVILDGPAAVNGSPSTRAGVYIRDLDPSAYAYDNSDLLLERGLPSISKKYGIPLDSFWSLGFSAENREDAAYFFNPYELAEGQKLSQNQVEDYGYLGGLMSLAPADTRVITYSVPLTLPDGTVIGVIGGDMSETMLKNFLNAGDEAGGSFRLLCRMQADSNKLEPVAANSVLFNTYFGKDMNLVLSAGPDTDIAQVTDKNGHVWYAAIRGLDIYSHNTPFDGERWVLVRMEGEETLFTFYSQMRKALSVSLLVSLAFGILGVFAVGSIVTDPIRRLIRELRYTGKGEPIVLSRTRIGEIDELIEAVEGLSADVAAAASKISDILDASGIPMGVFEKRTDTEQVFCSRSLFELLELPLPDKNYAYLYKKEFEHVMEKLTPEREEDLSSVLLASGSTRWIRIKRVPEQNGGEVGVLTDVTSDMTERRKLERERNYDLLTDIYNRRAFRETAERLIQTAGDQPMAFVMWDLDNLKYVNDTYGHEEGDRYICLFAGYLKSLELAGGIVERHAGDEFMAVLPSGTKELQQEILRDFMNHMKEQMITMADGYRIPLRASAGVAWYPEHARDFATLTRYADFAMYMAKHSVKGIVQEFTPESYRSNSYLLSGKEELNLLLENRIVRYALQPIVTREGEIYGYEALMRPDLTYLKGIQEVLYLARAQAKLNQLEDLTWTTALAWLDRREREGMLAPGARFFINSISSAVLSADKIRELEEKYPSYLNRIVLEVTEYEPREDYLEIKRDAMNQWHGMLAIDDFGSGYNNESLILKAHPDLIKLDMELISTVDRDPERRKMVKNVLEFCHGQKILVAAEGVETEGELSVLMELGVDLFQGYYLGRPEIEVRPLSPEITEMMRRLCEK